MPTLTLLLVVSAFIITVLSLLGRAPLAVAVLLLTVLELIRCLPPGTRGPGW